jgi:hypothetical protein
VVASIGPDGRTKVPEHVHAREFDGELVVVDLERGEYFGLDPIGTRLWRGLEDGSTPAKVAQALVGEYEVEYGQLLNDLVGLANELVDRGLLVAAG